VSSVGAMRDIESLLQRIGETGALPDPYAADAGLLFLAIHDQWVKNGGTVAGKRRNSIQTLADILRGEGNPVASLRSKINGETRLRISDAVALLDIYFSRWNFEANNNDDKLGYLPLKATDLEQARRLIIEALFGNQNAILLPRIEKDRKVRSRNAEAQLDSFSSFLAGRDVTTENFKISKAFVHISRIGSVEGPTTATAIRRFCEFINDYWKIDLKDNAGRQLIWVVDPGDRDINNDDSLAAFSNAEQLATFFRAVRLLSDPAAEARWKWLSNHAAVLVGSMDPATIDRLYASHFEELGAITADADLVRQGIKYSHFLLDTSPPNWLRSTQFAQLYGKDLEALENSSFLLCLDEAETRWRYFGYAPAVPPILAKDGKKSFVKFLELGSPGPAFDRVASIVHAAASFRLGSPGSEDGKEEQLRSILILRHLDFAVFRLSEFLNAETLSRSPP